MKAELRIKNFRTLNDVKVEMRPTTLLLGPNGAGKSTFIKSLIFLTGNLDMGKQSDKIIYDFPQKNINLRSFKNIVSEGDVTKDIEFTFNYNGEFDIGEYMHRDDDYAPAGGVQV